MENSLFFSSKSDQWSTPWWFFNLFNAKFCFSLDVCASAEDTKCERFISKEKDGLVTPWDNEVVWCNPPYGRNVDLWIDKAIRQTKFNTTTVMLLPARTDTKWFQNCWKHADQIIFIQGRIKFGDEKSPAPFPSVVIVFSHTGMNTRRPQIDYWNPKTEILS